MLATLFQTQVGGQGAWHRIEGAPQAVGFAEDEALLDADARVHPAYRLLTEILAFAPKFNFIDLPLPPAGFDGGGSRLTIHVVLSGLHAQAELARQLEQLQPTDLLTGCTPVVNLFTQQADPIRITQRDTSYPVLPDGARRAYGYEVHAVERVYRVQQTPNGEAVQEFLPIFSLRHPQLLAEGETRGRYWTTHRDETIAERSPGYETELSIVDIDFEPASPQTDTLSLDVRATNRDLPEQLMTIGNAGRRPVRSKAARWLARDSSLLRKPTASQRFEARPAARCGG